MIIIADDLTGASDSGIQFAKCGLRSIVIPQTHPLGESLFSGYKMIAINTDTRSKSRQEAYDTVYGLACDCKGHRVFKKIDSIMRGNPGTEILAVMKAFGKVRAYVAPSFPANRRTLVGGIMTTPTTTINILEKLEIELGFKVVPIPLSYVRQGSEAIKRAIEVENLGQSRFFVFDAETDEDLDNIYEAVESDQDGLCCGSAGFASKMAAHINSEIRASEPEKFPKESSEILLVVGSITRVTRAQLEKLTRTRETDVVLLDTRKVTSGALDEAVDETVEACLKSRGPLTAIAVDSLFNRPDMSSFMSKSNIQNAEHISKALGKIVERILDERHICSIIATGGDTALQICNALGVKGLEPMEEIVPGIPMNLAIGGKADGMAIVTKSGGFGNEDALIEIANYLERRSK